MENMFQTTNQFCLDDSMIHQHAILPIKTGSPAIYLVI